jgi:ATP-dependent RNA circularization protein (DNA/RNA ligase family)
MDNSLFIKYPEMKTLFKLIPSDEKGKKWDATSGEILPETAALHFIPLEELVFTEKIDGTNMGIRFDNGKVTAIQKRTDLCSREDKGDAFYFELGDKIADKIESLHIEQIESTNNDGVISNPLKNIIIYGELCGVKIQKGGNYFPERHFIVFDIYDTVSQRFFTWDAVKYFCELLGLETVPEIIYNRSSLDVDNVKDFICTQMSVYNQMFGVEGMVIRYRKDTSVVKRWMAKIRKKDFKIS